MTPTVELGVGDSTTIVNQLVTRNYTSRWVRWRTFRPVWAWRCPLMYRRLLRQSDAYEQLPIGDQKIYDTIGTARRTGSTR